MPAAVPAAVQMQRVASVQQGALQMQMLQEVRLQAGPPAPQRQSRTHQMQASMVPTPAARRRCLLAAGRQMRKALLQAQQQRGRFQTRTAQVPPPAQLLLLQSAQSAVRTRMPRQYWAQMEKVQPLVLLRQTRTAPAMQELLLWVLALVLVQLPQQLRM